MTRRKKEPAETAIHTRIATDLDRRIEAIRIAYQTDAPPGIEISKSDSIRALLLVGVAQVEGEIAHREKIAREQARAAHRAEHGQEARTA